MTDRVRLTLAAVLTALFLAAVSAAGVLSHTHVGAPPASVSAPASAAPTAAPVAPATTKHVEND